MKFEDIRFWVILIILSFLSIFAPTNIIVFAGIMFIIMEMQTINNLNKLNLRSKNG